MAYFTEIDFGRALTSAEQASLDSYVADQTTAGTTDGHSYQWTYQEGDIPGIQKTRMWSTTEAANGFVSICNGFSPAPTSAKIY
jgi:hypothetical protein